MYSSLTIIDLETGKQKIGNQVTLLEFQEVNCFKFKFIKVSHEFHIFCFILLIRYFSLYNSAWLYDEDWISEFNKEGTCWFSSLSSIFCNLNWHGVLWYKKTTHSSNTFQSFISVSHLHYSIVISLTKAKTMTKLNMKRKKETNKNLTVLSLGGKIHTIITYKLATIEYETLSWLTHHHSC